MLLLRVYFPKFCSTKLTTQATSVVHYRPLRQTTVNQSNIIFIASWRAIGLTAHLLYFEFPDWSQRDPVHLYCDVTMGTSVMKYCNVAELSRATCPAKRGQVKTWLKVCQFEEEYLNILSCKILLGYCPIFFIKLGTHKLHFCLISIDALVSWFLNRRPIQSDSLVSREPCDSNEAKCMYPKYVITFSE